MIPSTHRSPSRLLCRAILALAMALPLAAGGHGEAPRPEPAPAPVEDPDLDQANNAYLRLVASGAALVAQAQAIPAADSDAYRQLTQAAQRMAQAQVRMLTIGDGDGPLALRQAEMIATVTEHLEAHNGLLAALAAMQGAPDQG